jgi:hypothetical protein
MGEISDRKQQYYTEAVRHCEAKIDEILKNEKELLGKKPSGEEGAALQNLALAEEMFNLTSCYVLENKIYKTVFNKSSEDILTDSRKALFKGISLMENAVTNWVDVPFSDYEEKIGFIASLGIKKTYTLVRKMGFAIDLFKEEYGENPKWKWSFVDLDGRCAAIAKNVMNLKSLTVDLTLGSANYEFAFFYVKMVKNLLNQAAEKFRQKYELSSQRIEDFKRSIDFLNALKRLHIILNERSDAEEVKKTVEVWTYKLNTDMKKKKESL